MGFYLELSRDSNTPEYRENFVPFVYLGLVIFSALALLGMGLAAHSLLAQLAGEGSSFWDKVLVFGPIACIPVPLLLGVKLVGMRKFIRFEGARLERGYRLFGRPIAVVQCDRDEVEEIWFENHRPNRNLAPAHHDNPAYYIRGHWRLGLRKKNGDRIPLDRHTEKEALIPLYDDLTAWLKA